MRRLGYKRCVAQDGDGGSIVADTIARQAPGRPDGFASLRGNSRKLFSEELRAALRSLR